MCMLANTCYNHMFVTVSACCVLTRSSICAALHIVHDACSLNWALNRAKVTPRGDAFNNPRQQLIADKLNAKPDKQGVLPLKVTMMHMLIAMCSAYSCSMQYVHHVSTNAYHGAKQLLVTC
jgi:hypothetical protein